MSEFVKKTIVGYKDVPGGSSDPDCTHVILTLNEYKKIVRGEDIHRCRANSIKLLCRLLYTLKESVALSLVDFMGGLKYNAIPREAEAIIAVPAAEQPKEPSATNTVVGSGWWRALAESCKGRGRKSKS